MIIKIKMKGKRFRRCATYHSGFEKFSLLLYFIIIRVECSIARFAQKIKQVVRLSEHKLRTEYIKSSRDDEMKPETMSRF